MCGIIGFIPKDNKFDATGKAIIEQYQRQLSRGQRGFGLMSIFPDKVIIDRATEPTKIILDTYMSKAPIQFFHHRMPTSTDNEMEQTHPFLVSHDELSHDYLLIHNGVIRNADALMKVHTEELGYIYKTLHKTQYSAYYSTNKFNDSESLAIEAARFFDGKSQEIGTLGTVALIIVRLDKKTNKPVDIIWSRNEGNPIEMVETKTGLLIASEVYHDDAELVPENTFEVLNLKKYFASKKEHKSIIRLVKAGEAKFKAIPPPVIVQRSTSAMGYGSQAIAPAKTETAKDDERDLSDVATARETAFARMADRVIDDMSEHVMQFFADLAYGDVAETEIVEIANELMDALIEKQEVAKDKVRPHFDRVEAAEYTESTPDYSPLENDEDEEDIKAYNKSYGISERADRSRARFEEIMF